MTINIKPIVMLDTYNIESVSDRYYNTYLKYNRERLHNVIFDGRYYVFIDTPAISVPNDIMELIVAIRDGYILERHKSDFELEHNQWLLDNEYRQFHKQLRTLGVSDSNKQTWANYQDYVADDDLYSQYGYIDAYTINFPGLNAFVKGL